MIPWTVVDRASPGPGAPELVLARRGDEWVVRAGGQVLMSSRTHGSEEALARLALGDRDRPRRVLVGGLGMGFTLRATLDLLPPDARVVLAELSAALVAWNRGPLADLAGRPLDDPRVRLQVDDVVARIAEAHGAYGAILLDVDNGPAALAQPRNDRLYGPAGLHAAARALAPGGTLAVWSAGRDDQFLARLEAAGLRASAHGVPARGVAGGRRNVIFLGRRPAPRGGAPGRGP